MATNQYTNSRLKIGTNGGFLEGEPAGATYNASGVTLSDGQLTAHQVDSAGNLKTVSGALKADLGTLINAAAATTTQNSGDLSTPGAKGIKVVLNVTNIGTGNITLVIQGKDSVSGNYYTILSGAAVSSNSTNIYTVYPSITVAANVSASDFIPAVWAIKVTANNANATTYTVGATVIG